MAFAPPKKIKMQGLRIQITGIVQGVGFRPFVYNLATRLQLKGWVKNTSAGVEIEVDGPQNDLDLFRQRLRDEAPALARIDEFSVSECPFSGFSSFSILHSESLAGAFQPISPDISICPDCLREMLDPTDRRHHYPFINCTNCGPRFTIIKDIPYDRPNTTMADFALCPDCQREYDDPANRRFHAQPVACPVCGPQIWLEKGTEAPGLALKNEEALAAARRLLAEGKIVAIKGLGGFHLACDATNAQSVRELRNRKLRVDKPFALMLPDLETIAQHCFVSAAERELLQSNARPIVLLKKKPGSSIVEEVSPRQDWLGVMLPYTPLHYLLFAYNQSRLSALVLTSGNLSEEPIATDNEDVRQRLSRLADAFLMHNRDIYIRCDDSVVRVVEDSSPEPGSLQTRKIYPLRRSRGYAPFPVKLPFAVPQLLAAGSELKNTFCITHKNYAFLSHHIGDMANYETLQSFEQGIQHFERLFRVAPEAIACDLHPNYLATRYALERAERENLPVFSVQHHHAHIASCMAENGLDGSRPLIGLSFDGTGYGEDGAIWGGEILIADYKAYQRAFHLEYFPLPGGDAAIKKPARSALALLWSLGLDWDETLAPVAEFCVEERSILRAQLEKKINSPLTSSMGRLFDAAAALAGVRQKVNYEGQAAIEFEALLDPAEAGKYPFGLEQDEIRLGAMLAALLADVRRGVQPSKISARFHNGLAGMAGEACLRIRSETGLAEVALSGGVWQNITLLQKTIRLLTNTGFKVYIQQEVPPNDGGLSLGQAAIAAARLRG